MDKTWKSQVGGILAIIGGVIGLLACMGLLIAITVLGTVWQWGMMPVNVIGILWIILVPMFICGVLAIVGAFAYLLSKSGIGRTGLILAILAALALVSYAGVRFLISYAEKRYRDIEV